jgi:hypothetical protein
MLEGTAARKRSGQWLHRVGRHMLLLLLLLLLVVVVVVVGGMV